MIDKDLLREQVRRLVCEGWLRPEALELVLAGTQGARQLPNGEVSVRAVFSAGEIDAAESIPPQHIRADLIFAARTLQLNAEITSDYREGRFVRTCMCMERD